MCIWKASCPMCLWCTLGHKGRKEEGHKGSVDMESFVPHVFMVYLRTQRQCVYGKLHAHVFMVYLRTQRQCVYGKLHAPCVYGVP